MVTTPDPAFVMSEDDRFHSILVSEPVRYPSAPGIETVLTFFVIRHARSFAIYHVLKTYKKRECFSRQVQSKENIPKEGIEQELQAIREVFSKAVERASGVTLQWHELDLRQVAGREEQLRLIQAWGRVNIWAE